jgi:hypothetical protein
VVIILEPVRIVAPAVFPVIVIVAISTLLLPFLTCPTKSMPFRVTEPEGTIGSIGPAFHEA